MTPSRGRYSGFPLQFVHPSYDWIQVLKAFVCSYFSWSLLSEAVTFVIWCCNQWSPSLRDRFSHGSWESILRTCQISKFHGQQYHEVEYLVGIYFSIPWHVDHCWTTPSLCTNRGFDPLQRHLCSPITDWWHRVDIDIEIWGPAPFVTLIQWSTLPPRTSSWFQIIW